MDRRLRNRSRLATFLCYHSVAPAGARFLTVSEQQFEAQLAELRRKGLRSGNLKGLEALSAGERIEPTVFLTFDDGFRDNYETVLPLLRERGETAFVFVLPPLLDDGAAFEWPEMVEETRRHPALMRSVTWPMVEAMKEGGFEIGSHTMTHPHLSLLDGEALREELLGFTRSDQGAPRRLRRARLSVRRLESGGSGSGRGLRLPLRLQPAD